VCWGNNIYLPLFENITLFQLFHIFREGTCIYAIKSQNGVVENYVFRPQNFRGKKPPKSDADILWSYMGTHQVEKFGAIPPTDPDDIS